MSPPTSFVLRSRRAVTPEGCQPADIAVTGSRITDVAAHGTLNQHGPVTDLGDTALLPGLVDTHVHINEPGRTQWEGFESATRAAAAGGVTTLLDMPLNCLPPTTTVAHLRVKQQAAEGRVRVDVGFWGGALPDNTADLAHLHEAGVFGFKSFLSPSGVDEFPHLEPADLHRTLTELTRIGALSIVHAESPEELTAAARQPGRDYVGYLASRPDSAETTAVTRLLDTAADTGARVHVLHVSAAPVLPLLRQARQTGARVSAETCPHYLCLAAEDVPDGATAFKCCPPIRSEANRDQLWQALAGGELVGVVSDHSPCTPELKHLDTGDFGTAWGGVSSLQLGLPAVWTEARGRGHQLTDVATWMATGPAHFAGLRRKGTIAAGMDADLVAFDPEATFTVHPESLHHRNPVTPYAGRRLTGVVHTTWLRGSRVQPDGEPHGQLLKRGD